MTATAPVAQPANKATRAQKIAFNQKHSALAAFAREYSQEHFLDLSRDAQETIREMMGFGRQKAQEGSNRRATAVKAENTEEANRMRKRRQKRKELHGYFPAIRLTDEALDRFLELGCPGELLRKLDQDQHGRHEVRGTTPKLFQRGHNDLRVYFRRDGSDTLVQLIGTKGTQDADYAAMQTLKAPLNRPAEPRRAARARAGS